MSILDTVIDAAVKLGKFLVGDKPQPKLEEPIGQLETEKTAQKIADRRRERAARKHGDDR